MEGGYMEVKGKLGLEELMGGGGQGCRKKWN